MVKKCGSWDKMVEKKIFISTQSHRIGTRYGKMSMMTTKAMHTLIVIKKDLRF